MKLFPGLPNIVFPICRDCNGPIIMGECGCGLPEEDDRNVPYINHCWNTSCNHAPIDSRTCRKSIIPGMGYHCPVCDKDLTEWKIKVGLLQAA